MADRTSIEWCHMTWSPWFGCQKVSKGCENCYASKLGHRQPGVFGIWGPVGVGLRRVAEHSAWAKPLAWDRKAQREGTRFRIFPSLCDPFEDWAGIMVDSYDCQQWHVDRGSWIASSQVRRFEGSPPRPVYFDPPFRKQPNEHVRSLTMSDVRARLGDLIRRTPNLDWLLLTKRPENAARMLAEMFGPDRSTWPTNFRVGTSVEDQVAADWRLPFLRELGWPNFVSAEPLLGFVRLDIIRGWFPDWVIVGGESGPGARPMYPDWARLLLDQCEAAGVPFLFKQWGEWLTTGQLHGSLDGRLLDAFERPTEEWPGGLKRYRVGKKAAGRALDGEIYDGFPEPAGVAHD